jgi:acyl carrier protein
LVEKRGVRHLLLLSRQGPAAPEAPELRAHLEALGAQVTIAACSVEREDELARCLAAIPVAQPLKAVFHLAAVLRDGPVERLHSADLQAVLGPKVLGALHLHKLTASLDLDAFVLFSSAAGLLGHGGQCLYSAANAFLDALADHRRRGGKVGLSLAWGPWAEVGMVPRLSAQAQALIEQRGLVPLPVREALALLDQCLARTSRPWPTVDPVDPVDPVAPVANDSFANDRMAENSVAIHSRASLQDPAATTNTSPSYLVPLRLHTGALREAAAASPSANALDALDALPALLDKLLPAPRTPRKVSSLPLLQERLPALPPAEHLAFVTGMLVEELARVFRLPKETIDTEQPLKDMGLDSLLAVELRQKMEALSGLRLPPAVVFDHPSVRALAKMLLEELTDTLDVPHRNAAPSGLRPAAPPRALGFEANDANDGKDANDAQKDEGAQATQATQTTQPASTPPNAIDTMGVDDLVKLALGQS